ncbi:hypothetical protein [Xanthomonas theicola]|uniref:hypothetical protein n=1 Tax=Xanthomonas theicola TaxID=56464 RepID=UPI000FF8AC85|nr:hypothetical protein G4Q83_17585 [Xanthomonas theicola]
MNDKTAWRVKHKARLARREREQRRKQQDIAQIEDAHQGGKRNRGMYMTWSRTITPLRWSYRSMKTTNIRTGGRRAALPGKLVVATVDYPPRALTRRATAMMRCQPCPAPIPRASDFLGGG